MKIHHAAILAILAACLVAGCVGRTGRVGTPISAVYEQQLDSLKLGVSTPEDLEKAFTFTVTNDVGYTQYAATVSQPSQKTRVTVKKVLVSLKSASLENGKKVEIYEVRRTGGMDAASFIMWGYVAYNKDQELLFRFEDGKLASFDSVVLPDPAPAPSTPVNYPNHH